MKWFIIFSVVLVIMLIATSLLLDNLMGIFIVGVVVCLFIDRYGKDKSHNKPE